MEETYEGKNHYVSPPTSTSNGCVSEHTAQNAVKRVETLVKEVITTSTKSSSFWTRGKGGRQSRNKQTKPNEPASVLRSARRRFFCLALVLSPSFFSETATTSIRRILSEKLLSLNANVYVVGADMPPLLQPSWSIWMDRQICSAPIWSSLTSSASIKRFSLLPQSHNSLLVKITLAWQRQPPSYLFLLTHSSPIKRNFILHEKGVPNDDKAWWCDLPNSYGKLRRDIANEHDSFIL